MTLVFSVSVYLLAGERKRLFDGIDQVLHDVALIGSGLEGDANGAGHARL